MFKHIGGKFGFGTSLSFLKWFQLGLVWFGNVINPNTSLIDASLFVRKNFKTFFSFFFQVFFTFIFTYYKVDDTFPSYFLLQNGLDRCFSFKLLGFTRFSFEIPLKRFDLNCCDLNDVKVWRDLVLCFKEN